MTQDLVVASYGPDIPLLRTLMSSIDRFVPVGLFNKLWLIVTDDTPISDFRFVHEGKHRWLVIHISDVFTPHTVSKQAGYINQQLAKLMIAKLVDSDWYWTFDSKNFLIKDINEAVLYRDGKARVSIDHPSVHWNLGWKACLDHYDIRYNRPIINLTPYPIHSDSMKSLISSHDDMAKDFAQLYLDKGVCEFFFYNGYIFQQEKFDSLYQPDGMLKVTIWPNELSDPVFQPNAIKHLLENPRRDKPIWCGGLHKDAIAKMTSEQASSWAGFLVWLELFPDHVAVHDWYASVLDK